MSIALKTLCTENDNQFRLTLRAGRNGFRNAVTWVYVLEDGHIIPYFHGSELAVTTGIPAASDPGWLLEMVGHLVERGAAGLVINTGKFVLELPQELLDYCDERDFPLLTMPWEIHVTEMIQDFCTRIIQERNDNELFIKAILDTIYKRGDEEECRQILSRYYDVAGTFTVILIRTGPIDGEFKEPEGLAYAFINRLRRFKTIRGITRSKFGVVGLEDCELLMVNNMESAMLQELLDIILESYREEAAAHSLFIGVGIQVTGVKDIGKSYQRARTAMQMAVYRNVPYVHFEDMGFFKILFSVKDEDVLHAYADEILSPLERGEGKHQDYIELLQAYIKHDRSLERTAAELYLHRNTVNYRLQKMKALLGCQLKTVEDLFPYQVALAIRDMERNVTFPSREK